MDCRITKARYLWFLTSILGALGCLTAIWHSRRLEAFRAASNLGFPVPTTTMVANDGDERITVAEAAVDAAGRWVYVDASRRSIIFGDPRTRVAAPQGEALNVDLGNGVALRVPLAPRKASVVTVRGMATADLGDRFDEIVRWLDQQRSNGGSLDPQSPGAPTMTFR